MSLSEVLRQRIDLQGPMSIAEYMVECLLHPTYGYYTRKDPLGATGDFITAPEISQMFGELLGLALAQSWLDQGAPERFTLAELGPGRGTLMSDILRAAAAVPGFAEAAEVTLFEASPALQSLQRQALVDHHPRWIDEIEDLSQQPLFLVANEFFDALPIRQFVRDGEGWRERQVGLEGETFVIGLGPSQPQPALEERFADAAQGTMIEDSPAIAPIAHAIGSRIATHGGAALIIDYGDWHSRGDTFQAVRNHSPTDLLSQPGEADLTAHVDFEALALASPSAHSAMTPQGVFLERLGISHRAQRLAESTSGNARADIISAHRRLTHPEEMGTLFKVLGLYPADAPLPPGLET